MIEDDREAKLLEIPKSYQGIFKRAWGGKSRKAAVKAACIECMGYAGHEVKECTVPTCPLYDYRDVE